MIQAKRIYIMGFMGAGKSTLGRKLAKILGYTFIDLDHVIAQHCQASIGEIFSSHGEDYFRNIEHQLLVEQAKNNHAVISLGGGTPLRQKNLEIILRDISIYVKMPEIALFQRLIHSKNPRPLIQGLSEEQLKSFIHEKLKEREPIYLQANIHIDGLNYSPESLRFGLENLT